MDKIEIIKDAILSCKKLSFSYQSKTGITTRSVEPYKIIYMGRSAYLWAWCLLRNEGRTFKLDNISDLSEGETFLKRNDMPEPNCQYYMRKN